MAKARLALLGLLAAFTAGSPGLAVARARLPGEKVVDLTLGPFRIEAARDREVCQAFRVRGAAGMEVVVSESRSRVQRRGLVGSHHLVVYGYKGTQSDRFPSGIVDDTGCGEFGPGDFYTNRVFVGGSGGENPRGGWSVTKISMPGDLAQVLPGTPGADAVVVVNSHYFNGSPRPGRGLVKVRLRLAPLEAGKRVVRQVVQTDASRDIMVAPGGTGRVEAEWKADGSPPTVTGSDPMPLADVCVFSLATHMHGRGTRFTIDWESNGQVQRLLDWADWLHAGVLLRPGGDGVPGLLRAYTAENGFPRFRYACETANGTSGRSQKMGCEEVPGQTPGRSQADVAALGMAFGAARPCGQDGANCDGAACVPANLVFGPLSDDEMCVLTATVYDPLPGVAPERACDTYAQQ